MFWALVKKELRLQRSNILFALTVILVWFLDFLIVFLGDRPLGSKIITTGTLAQIIHYFFILPGLIAIFPIMVGATSIAHERQLGTFEWQATLPASGKLKWLVKIGVPLFLSILMGGFLLGIMDHIFVWNLRIHDIQWSLGKGDFDPLPFRMKGLYPGIFPILFCAMGIYVSSIFKDPYRALIFAFAFLVFTLLAQKMIDPAGMLTPLGETFPARYLHLSVHYFRILFLSFFLIWMGLLNFHPQPREKRTYFFQVLFWIILVNITGYFTLKWEFNPGRLSGSQKILTPGLNKLLELRKSGFSCPIFRIPNSSKIATSLFMDKDASYFMNYQDERFSGHIIEISIDTGRKKIIPGLFGYIKEISPKGQYYTVKQSITNKTYNVMRSGIVVPSKMYDQLNRILGSSSEPAFSWEKPYYSYSTMKRTMVIKTSSGDIVHKDITASLVRKVGDIEEYHIHTMQNNEEKHINYLVRRTAIPDTYELIDQNQGNTILWLSPDGRWYSKSSVMLPINLNVSVYSDIQDISPEKREMIITTDGSTSYTIREDDNTVVLINYREKSLMRISQDPSSISNLSLSPDGRFLLYISIPSGSMELNKESFTQNSPKELEFRILDLKNGKKTLLERFPESLLSVKRLDYLKKTNLSPPELRYQMLNNLTVLPCAWSNDYKLAVLYYENLYLYQYIQGEERFIPLGRIDVANASIFDTDWDHFFYFLRNTTMDFWSNNTILILNLYTPSLWKLDLREYFSKKEAEKKL